MACSECANVYGSAYSSTAGSTLCDTCTKSYYRTLADKCEECPSNGVDCNDEGSTLTNLRVVQNYFRFSQYSEHIYLCDTSNCEGVPTDEWDATNVSFDYCKEGSFGPLCEFNHWAQPSLVTLLVKSSASTLLRWTLQIWLLSPK